MRVHIQTMYTAWRTVYVYGFPAKSGIPRRLWIVPFTTQNWRIRIPKNISTSQKKTATSLLFRKQTLKATHNISSNPNDEPKYRTVFKKYAVTAECHATHSNSDPPPHRPALARPSVTVVDSPRAISILASPRRSPTCGKGCWSLKGMYIDIYIYIV